jgi:molybdate-binding protein/DNA-binding transcriptional regulator YhcF (GntR family)
MEAPHLYQQIVDSIRTDILIGKLEPGAALPSMRKMTEQWGCTTGTILRAYQELARQGLVVSHVGRGTKVAERVPEESQTPLRRASLFNRTEAFLLEVMTSGYSPDEVEQAFMVALDRWRVFSSQPEEASQNLLRFVGSHDPALAMIAAHYHAVTPGYTIKLTFTTGLGGLKALEDGSADLAGIHMWHDTTDTYNEIFVRKLLPGRTMALLTLAHRRVGLIVPLGNPLELKTLKDLTRTEVRFANRRPGAGMRTWLDARLAQERIPHSKINGYGFEKESHSEVARAVSNGQANVGLGVESAALAYGLGFQELTAERYDLVIPADKWQFEAVRALSSWLDSPQAKAAITNMGGYDTKETGSVTWVD